MSEPAGFIQPRPPMPARALSGLIGGLGRLGVGRDWLTPGERVATARHQTGLTQLGSPGFEDRMEQLVDSLHRQSSLTPLGRMAVHRFLLVCATNRLRITELLRRHPEILEIPIERPIFIMGWPRTGTTALHDLLSVDPQVRAPRLWELQRPVPVDYDRSARDGSRIKVGEKTVQFTRRVAPGMMASHPLNAHLPDECQFLFDNDMFTVTFMAFQARAYGDWILETHPVEFYDRYRTQLQILLWQRAHTDPSRTGPLVLKWPFHLWFLGALLEVFPDARVIQTHRDVTRAFPSFCSLMTTVQSMFCDRIDPKEFGSRWLAHCARGMERAIVARDGLGRDEQFYDLNHARLVVDHAAELARIYAHFGLTAPLDHAARIRRYLAEDPRGHRGGGRHRYDLRWFDLSAGAIRARFGAYHRRFGDQV